MTTMQAPSACPDDVTMAALAAGELTSHERSRVLEHAADCDDCRELISELAATEGGDGADTAGLEGLERYELLVAIGAGGMGVVYAAHDRELDRRVALKVLRDDGPSAPSHRSLLAEARAMAKLAHPNVVRVFDVGEHEGRVFVTMELVEGGTLRAFLEGPARSFREIAKVFGDAGRGLAAAHQAGLVHRDFKPENVLMRDGAALVSDFGLARVVAGAAPGVAPGVPAPARSSQRLDTTRASALAGTLRYMAPEQLRRERVDARTDLFSFCVAFWEALYGELPFAGATPPELLEAMRAGPSAPRARSDVPRHTREALVRGLSFAPSDRPPSMHALLAEALPEAATAPPRRTATLLLAVVAAALCVAAYVRYTTNITSTTSTTSTTLPSSTTPAASGDGAPGDVAAREAREASEAREAREAASGAAVNAGPESSSASGTLAPARPVAASRREGAAPARSQELPSVPPSGHETAARETGPDGGAHGQRGPGGLFVKPPF